MKKCPECNRTYAGDDLVFCLEDGSILSALYSTDKTLVLPPEEFTVVKQEKSTVIRQKESDSTEKENFEIKTSALPVSATLEASPAKTARTIYWVVTGIFCLMMFIAAAIEIFAFHASVGMLGELGYPSYIAYVLPVTKFFGAIAILTRRSKTLTEWAYAGFFFDFVLAALAHYFAGVPSPIPAMVALVLLMTSYFLGRRIYD